MMVLIYRLALVGLSGFESAFVEGFQFEANKTWNVAKSVTGLDTAQAARDHCGEEMKAFLRH
ncbi:hypothetical protein [Ralstonia pseudosolanacearum]|uniref:hypothetical protein n=1 Tax=Ralstonia pseudosolanacearum TaxID=1310165 RepID=UPI0018D060E1|nr:hypothetical protein [Ralstonia pseudosolanacearum]